MLGFLNLMLHMKKEHPESKWFGDSVLSDESGNIISQKCQICGKEIAGNESIRSNQQDVPRTSV